MRARETWCKLNCWQLYLFDWLIILSFSALTILNCDRQFCFLTWLNVWFYFTVINLTIWQLWNIHISLDTCHSATITPCFGVHYIATCLIFVFAVMNCISKVMDDGWFTKFYFCHVSQCISSFWAHMHRLNVQFTGTAQYFLRSFILHTLKFHYLPLPSNYVMLYLLISYVLSLNQTTYHPFVKFVLFVSVYIR